MKLKKTIIYAIIDHVDIYEDNIMKLNKNGFTLTELLIALAVIGILIAILIPVIRNIMPNQKVLMAKRARYTIESIVSNLLNDSACYPDEDENDGFDNGFGYADCDLWGGNEATASKITTLREGDVGLKFRTLFRNRMQLDPDNGGDPAANPMILTTKDGMRWSFLTSNDNIIIAIDVNGAESGGGADVNNDAVAGLSENNVAVLTNCVRDCDVAVFQVNNDGDVSPLGTWTTAAINVNTRINAD